MPDFFDQAKEAGRSSPRARPVKGLDQANEMADEKTGGRFDDQTDAAQDKVEGVLGLNPQDDNNH